MGAQGERGYSLTELLIVISLLGLISAVATSGPIEDNQAPLDRAVEKTTAAFRFAHSEAVRTGEPHGVEANIFTDAIRVFRFDVSGSPVFDVRDRVTKQIYTLQFETDTLEPELTFAYFKFEGFIVPQMRIVYTGGTGVPKYTFSGTNFMLESGYVRLRHDGVDRRIDVSPMTARVSVQ